MDYQEKNNEMKITRTMEALKKNNIDSYFAKSHAEAAEIVRTLVVQGSKISCGGSVSLDESGIMDLMKSGIYNFLDRNKPGLTQEDIKNIYLEAYDCDAFFMSANAVTENGELYNVDGNGNRISALIHGPKKVVAIVGVNKIVKDIDAAVYRVKTVAAPCNAIRLNTCTPCMYTGKCVAANKGMTEGCGAEKRMCVHYLVSAYQRNRGRISVIFLNENLGY